MKKATWTIALLAMAAVGVLGQDVTPLPDKDGVYAVYGEVKPAKLIHSVEAVYPADPKLAGQKYVCALSVVVGADGVPADIGIANSHTSPYDEAAVAALLQSRFDPGTLHRKPVPVRTFVWVPFVGGGRPALPVTGAFKDIPGMTMPTPANNVEAEFSDEARRKGISGAVLVQVLVTEKGLPAAAHVVKPAGYGLDEKSLEAVRKYRFKPATLDGVPVTVMIMVEINFRLGSY